MRAACYVFHVMMPRYYTIDITSASCRHDVAASLAYDAAIALRRCWRAADERVCQRYHDAAIIAACAFLHCRLIFHSYWRFLPLMVYA